MKSILIFFVYFLLSGMLFRADADDRSIVIHKKDVATIERRYALVIGNSSYQDAPLKNPINDADAMVLALKEAGFNVIVSKNADRRTMFTSIKEFGQKLKKSDVGLFYYAGHGVQVESANYLLPVDLRGSDLQDADDLRRDAVPMSELMERMRDAGTNNIVILDACRDNPFLAKLTRSSSRGLAKVITPANTSILYSTDPGNTASDGSSGENGVFTKRLVEAVQKEGIELVDVMREVSVAVNRDTNGTQRPIFDGILSSKFYFHPVEGPNQNVAEQPFKPFTTDPKSIELSFWQSAEKNNSLPAYKLYLKKYPSGEFAELASDRIQMLEKTNSQNDDAFKLELARKAIDAAEQRLAKEKTEQELRMNELEKKIMQAEERARQLEVKSEKALPKQEESVQQTQVAMIPKSTKLMSTNDQSTLSKYFTTSDLMVTDSRTGLTWVRNVNITGDKIIFENARSLIELLNKKTYAGYNDWRFPTAVDYKTLYTTAKLSTNNIKDPQDVIKEVFKNYKNWSYWCNTGNAGVPRLGWRGAYVFDFEYGTTDEKEKNDGLYIMIVRGQLN